MIIFSIIKNCILFEELNRSISSKFHLNISSLKLLNIDTNIFNELVNISCVYVHLFFIFSNNFSTFIVYVLFFDIFNVISLFFDLFSFSLSGSVSNFFRLSSIMSKFLDSEKIFGYSIQTFCSFVNGWEAMPNSFNKFDKFSKFKSFSKENDFLPVFDIELFFNKIYLFILLNNIFFF